jgi:hypothetical protein
MSQKGLRALADAHPDGVVNAERQAGDLPIHVNRLGLCQCEAIRVNLEHVELELSVAMCRDNNAIVKSASV